MNDAVPFGDSERFRAAILNCLGLQFEDAKLAFLGDVLRRRLETLRRSSDSYLWGLEKSPSSDELGALARELTVAETYFFRNNEQFRALAEIVLPERMRAQAASQSLRLLSAGCASGEEAFTMAIVIRETIADPSWEVSIRAVDVNPAGIEKAKRARFSTWALRETPADIQRRWFHAEGRDLVLDEEAKTAVKFEERNLAADDPELWQPGAYDAIFCRNVLMYFAPEQARAAMARMAHALAPGGFLFLGHAETMRGLSDDFHLRHTHGTFYYRRKENGARGVPQPAEVAPRHRPTSPPAATIDEAWFETINDSSYRVEALIPPGTVPNPPTCPPSREPSLTHALDLLCKERFPEALACVRELSMTSPADPDVLLLEAMLLAHSGALTAAEDTCRRLLLVDGLNAGAHYILALCREGMADRDAASEHDRVAVYLDPGFAMPRLHLGLLARRAGDRETARRELRHAFTLLKREDASRLLLFGGGFDRAALIALCGSALNDCGGRT